MLDDTDRRSIRGLQNAPSASIAELAETAGLSQGIVARRLMRLRETGVLRGQQAVINWSALGYAANVSLRIRLEKSNPRAFDEFLAAAREIPEVLEIQAFLGRVDVRLVVIARDMGHYQSIYRDAVLTLPHIAEIEALMQVAEIKMDARLPI